MMAGVLRNPRMVIEVYQLGKRFLYIQSQRRYYYRFCGEGLCRISKEHFLQIVGEYKND